jgi:type 1 glutamine amidotransferase
MTPIRPRLFAFERCVQAAMSRWWLSRGRGRLRHDDVLEPVSWLPLPPRGHRTCGVASPTHLAPGWWLRPGSWGQDGTDEGRLSGSFPSETRRVIMADPRYANSQRSQRCLLALAVSGLLFGSDTRLQAADTTGFTILVFSKTTGFRHDSIPDGIAAIRTLGAEHGFTVDTTEDATTFTDGALARYKAVVFLSTTGDVLDPEQKAAFERYIRSGGGFAGIHSASDTEYNWPWYGRLVGAYFASHPQIQQATVHIADPSNPSTKGLPAIWERTDEWYDFRTNPRGIVHVLATVDEATYSGGKMGADHPIAWCHMMEGGRSWYTAMGHTKGSYAEPFFQLHLLGGIESAAGAARGCLQP